MKKIQISTVKQTADVQVINLNAYFIAKAVRTQIEVQRFIKILKDQHVIEEVYELVKDENGNPVFDEFDRPKEEFKGYEYKCNSPEMGELVEHVITLNESVIPFLNELVDAFEAE